MACPGGSPHRILIGGGTGFIGSSLCNLLTVKGINYTIISRMPGPKNISWQEIQKDGIPRHTTAVVNLAGQNVLNMKRRWTEGYKQNVWNSRVQTTCILKEAIVKATKKPDVFIAISGVGIYEPSADKTYTEDSRPLYPYDFMSELCHAWENAAKLPPTMAEEVRQVTIRSGVVLGRKGGMIKQMYLPFACGLGGPVMPGDQYLPWIHISDITQLILYSIENNRIRGVLNGVAPHAITNKQFATAFGKALRRPAVIPVPKFALELLLNKERANMLTTGQKVSPQRTEGLGYNFIFPTIESACESLVTGGSPPFW